MEVDNAIVFFSFFPFLFIFFFLHEQLQALSIYMY